MKIADKVKALVIPLVLIPFIIILCGALLFGRIYLKKIFGNGTAGGLEAYASPVFAMNSVTQKAFSEIINDVQNNPDQLLDKTYLQDLNDRLDDGKMTFIVRIEDEIYYSGSEKANDLIALLPAYGDNNQLEGGFFVEASDPFFLQQQDFTLSDGRTGSAFIITYTDSVVKNMKRIVIEMMVMIIGVLMLVSGFTSLYIYWIFIRPLKLFQAGTERIKEGNLEEDVEILADDELGEVCQSFNEMRKKLKESVDDRMRQEQENRELISNISHDLKTPITAIKGYVEGIMDGVADTPEKRDRYIRTIYNKANEMDALINELSLYTKIDNNSIPYNFVKVNVASYFDDCVEDISMDMEAANVAFEYENTCPRDTRVIADPEQIRRVIGNIVTNAVKYNQKEQRRVQIKVQPWEDNSVCMSIRDNGNGIAAKDLPRIFKRMYRTDSSRNSSTGGSGLGLAIAKKIIEEHGGTIWAESEEGIGTMIAFTLKIYTGGQENE